MLREAFMLSWEAGGRWMPEALTEFMPEFIAAHERLFKEFRTRKE